MKQAVLRWRGMQGRVGEGMNDEIFDSTRICPVCGREFYTPDPETWVYKKSRGNKSRIYFCRYSCKKAYEQGSELTGRGMRVSVKKRQIWKALDDGLSVREIAVLLDVPPKQVSYYKSRWVPKEA